MPENKYRVVMNGSTYDITEDGVSYRVIKDNKPYGSIDLKTASKEAIMAFQLGIFFGTSQVLDRMQEQTVQPNQYGNQPAPYPFYDDVNANYQPSPYNQGEAPMGNGQGMNQGSSNKTLTLGNGHSIIGSEPSGGNNTWMQGGFVNKLVMALIAGVGLGIITATIYIFTNLGKVTFNL